MTAHFNCNGLFDELAVREPLSSLPPEPRSDTEELLILRLAVLSAIFPYGLASEAETFSQQILEAGRQCGMTDNEVYRYLSNFLTCGGRTVYDVDEQGRWHPEKRVGFLAHSQRVVEEHETDRPTYQTAIWAGQTAPASGGVLRAPTWQGREAYDAFRTALGIPYLQSDATTLAPAVLAGRDGQLLLF